MNNFKDLSGRVFDDITVIKFSHKEIKGYGNVYFFDCKCKCGKDKIISGKTLRNKNFSSCGCKNSRGETVISKRLVCGKGINDADYVLSKRIINEDGTTTYLWRCPFYEVWCSMLKRCYSEKYKPDRIDYEKPRVCEEWLTFSNFKAWMEKQDFEGKVLDKDLIVKGNKIYCPEACSFVSNKINCFLNKCTKHLQPSFKEKQGKYHARISNPVTNKEEHLGYFYTKEDAIYAWKIRKVEIAKILAKEDNLHEHVRNLLINEEELCQYLNIQC